VNGIRYAEDEPANTNKHILRKTKAAGKTEQRISTVINKTPAFLVFDYFWIGF